MSLQTNTALKAVYRLLFPGSLLLVIGVVLIKLGVVLDPDSRLLRLLPIAVFLVGLVLSAVFRRSRIFFALLALALAQTALVVVGPRLSPARAHVLGSIVGILLPLNLLTMAFLKERGIISPPGRRRLVAAGLQVVAAAML